MNGGNSHSHGRRFDKLWALVACVLTLATFARPAQALDGPQNRDPEVCQGVFGAAYSVNEAADWISPPPVDFATSIAAYGANLGLKSCPPQIVAPAAKYLMPDSTAATSNDAEAADPQTQDPACYATVRQSTTKAGYDNFLGATLRMENWGDLGTPTLYHFNTSADVRLLGNHRLDDPATPDVDESLRDEMPLLRGNTLKFGVGRHLLTYRADTLLSWLDFVFIYIPKIPSGSKEQKEAVKASAKLTKEVLEGAQETILTEWGTQAADQVFDLSFRHHQWGSGRKDVFNQDSQQVWVFDRIPPVIHASTDVASLPERTRAVVSYDSTRKVYYVEAIQPGGIKASDAVNFLRPLITAHDHCNNDVTITSDSGHQSFWSTGQQINLTWMATDPGPIDSNGGRNTATVVQTVEVRDTHAPALLAPPSKVVEVPSGQTSEQVPLGSPRVYDLANLSPTVSNDASGDTFGLGLNQITWMASDGTNSTSAVQLITVKEEGTNKPPVADAQTVATQAFKDTEITLSGNDPDFYPNVKRHDPLTFGIVTPPQNGYFVAPLLPFFIDDYRLEASAREFTSEPWQQDPAQYCRDRKGSFAPGEPSQWQVAYPYRAEWMAVDDDDNTIVSDTGSVLCTGGSSGDLTTNRRLAIFNSEHDLVANTDLSFGGTVRDIYWDLDTKHVYLVTQDTQGDDFIYVYGPTLERIATYNLTYGGGANTGKTTVDPAAITVDSTGIMYVANEQTVNAYRQVQTSTPYDGILPASSYLGSVFTNPSPTSGFRSIAVDSKGNLDVGANDRVFQIRASKLEGGVFTPGTSVGWLGRCSENLTNTYACDVKQEISIGFSCTDTLCGRSKGVYGDKPGQFAQEQAIAIDPNDVLYVADTVNDRVQRFTSDGLFAGQARSTGVGYGFLLGDFGSPYDIEVNSGHFYVLNTDANLLHIFETTPITPIDDAHAKVVYRSNDNYVGADSFRFSVTDGLASAEADVTLDVSRNYRPPTIPKADEPIIEPATAEDSPAHFTLNGSDPDGALDTLSVVVTEPPQHGTVDFNGLQATYTPEANYNGPDGFSYQVSDGRDSSAETGHVSLTVDPVADAPTIDANESRTASVGFKMGHRVDVFDPDAGEVLEVTIDWGDATTTREGHFELNGKPVRWQDARNEDGTAKDGVTTTGPILQTDPDGRGALLAEHAYTRAGAYNVTSCVIDQAHLDDATQVKTPTGASQQACVTTQVTVTPTAEVAIDFTSPDDPVNAGATVTLPVSITNLQFDVASDDPRRAELPPGGSNVAGFSFKAEAAPGLKVLAARPESGVCNVTDSTVDCAIAQLTYGQHIEIDIDAQVAADAPGKSHPSLAAKGEWLDMREAATGVATIEVKSTGDAPTLDSISDESGLPAGYEQITLQGSHFETGARVKFGTLYAREVRVTDAHTLTARTPAQPDGTEVDVSVVNPDDQTATLTMAYTYQAATPAPTPSPQPTPNPTPGGNGGKGDSGGGGGALDLRMVLALAFVLAMRRAGWRSRQVRTARS